MVEAGDSSDSKRGGTGKGRSVLHKLMMIVIVCAALIILAVLGVFVFNNISFISNAAFAKRVDAAIESSERWVDDHKSGILRRKNIGLLKMLKECDKLKGNLVFKEITVSFMEARVHPECWKRLMDPNWPVDEMELNRMIEQEDIDNKWVLYAIAPEKSRVSAEELDLFNPERWQQRHLTHQLNALVILKKKDGQDVEKLDKLIEHLCNRVRSELFFDAAVVDVYIQKVAFILRADFPEKIRRRWIERIIANQLPDGGWNNRWFCFTSSSKLEFDLETPPSDQHATIQALTVLYLVKYRYPKHFGL